MNKKSIIYVATIIIIVSIVSAGFIYFNQSTASSQTNTQKNITVVDDEGYSLG